MLLKEFIRTVWRIRNYERIPKLPRVLAGKYKSISTDEARVLNRLGARCPQGVQAAVRRAGVSDGGQLAGQLEHYRPARRFMARLDRLIGRFFGALDYEPHREQIAQVGRRARRAQRDPESASRIRHVIETFKTN